jgi:hypothetical protein
MNAELKQREEAIFQRLKQDGDVYLRRVAELMAGKQPHEIINADVELRDLAHQFVSQIVQSSIEEDKKREA